MSGVHDALAVDEAELPRRWTLVGVAGGATDAAVAVLVGVVDDGWWPHSGHHGGARLPVPVKGPRPCPMPGLVFMMCVTGMDCEPRSPVLSPRPAGRGPSPAATPGIYLQGAGLDPRRKGAVTASRPRRRRGNPRILRNSVPRRCSLPPGVKIPPGLFLWQLSCQRENDIGPRT